MDSAIVDESADADMRERDGQLRCGDTVDRFAAGHFRRRLNSNYAIVAGSTGDIERPMLAGLGPMNSFCSEAEHGLLRRTALDPFPPLTFTQV